MSREKRLKIVTEAFENLHEQGQGWVHGDEIGEQAALSDEHYMRRYNFGRRLLGLFRINRPDKPDGFFYLGKIYPELAHLETQGIVESRWEEHPNETLLSRRMYRMSSEIEANLDNQ